MKLGVVLAALIGLAIAVYVVLHIGVKPVLGAIESAGLGGFALLCVASLVLPLILGTAWFALVPDADIRRLPIFILARQIRDSASDVLPFSQLGGIVVGVRAIILRGLSAPLAFASGIADITTELMAQLAFIVLGVVLFVARTRTPSAETHIVEAIAIGLGVMIPGVAAFVFLQRRGSAFAMKLAERWLPSAVRHAAAFDTFLERIYAAPLKLAASATIHLLGWIASGAVIFLAIRLVGGKIDFLSAIAIESMLGGLRSATAFVPASIGVQEAGYAALMPLFGLGPEVGLAVSLLKRARDIAVGAPILLAWQAMEGQRAFGRPSQSAPES